MWKKIVGIIICMLLVITSLPIVTATLRTNSTRLMSTNNDNNEGNGIRIKVSIYPLIGSAEPRRLMAKISHKDYSHCLDGTFTIKLTYKDNELYYFQIEGGFCSSFSYQNICSEIIFSYPVIGSLFVDFTGIGKDDGLYESIIMPVIIYGYRTFTWGHTVW